MRTHSVPYGAILPIARCTSGNWRLPHWRVVCVHAVQLSERDRFRRILTWLSQNFKFCSMGRGLAFVKGDEALSVPSVTVTFDDADRSVYDVAMPLLDEFGIKACLYVVADYIHTGRTYRDEMPAPAMNLQQLRTWAAAGHEVGSHTFTHAPAPYCTGERLRWELTASRITIEDWLGAPVHHFSYPWGQHDPRARSAILAGQLYDSAATIRRGRMHLGHDPYTLRRDVLNVADGISKLETLMRLTDHFYWLRKIRKARDGYWKQHPELTWPLQQDCADVPGGARTEKHVVTPV